MNRYGRYLLVVMGVVPAVFAVGAFFQVRAVTDLWPLPYTSPMSFIFLASIAAAAAVSTLWCAAAQEGAAVAGIALDYITIFTPLTVLILQLAGRSSDAALTAFGVLCGVTAVFGLGMLIWSLRIPPRDPRPMPRPVRIAFVVFVIALLFTGGQMITKNTHILPWQVSTDVTIIYGWMFLGAAAYFAYGILRPGWYNAVGQLGGFLAYDLVLLVPFLQKLPTIEPDLRLNLIVYLIVVCGSGLLAIYYLFVYPATRSHHRA